MQILFKTVEIWRTSYEGADNYNHMQGYLAATSNPYMCPQYPDIPPFQQSEDCLYLNVYAPPDARVSSYMLC